MQLAEIYTELEFLSLLKGIDTATAVPVDGFVTVRSSQQLAELVDALQGAELLVVDTETTSLNARKARLVGISLCTNLERAWYIPIGHLDEDGTLAAGQLDKQEVLAALQPFLLSTDMIKVAHNLKYDFTVIKQQWGIELGGPLADTLIAAYLLESEGRSLKLDDLCQQRGLKMTSFDEVVAGDKREDCFAYVDIEKAGIYSCEDVYGTLVLWQEFEPLLQQKRCHGSFPKG